jgi:hypothetical protein
MRIGEILYKYSESDASRSYCEANRTRVPPATACDAPQLLGNTPGKRARYAEGSTPAKGQDPANQSPQLQAFAKRPGTVYWV